MTETVLVVAGTAPGIGGMDSGNQGWLTANAMRRYLGWDAKCLVFGESYLNYNSDWVLGQNVTLNRIMDYANECTLFVFMDSIVPEFTQFLRPDNHCLLGIGTGLRSTASYVLMDQIRHGLPVLVPLNDETLTTQVCGIPFPYVIIDVDEIEALTEGIDKNDEFTVCYAHTNRTLKGGDLVDQIIAEYPDIRFEAISGLSWEDSIRAKARCHAIIDSLAMPYYGLNCLEAGILHQHVVSNIGPWAYMMHPDFPFSSVNPHTNSTGLSIRDSIRDQLVALSEAPEMWEHKLPAAYDWVVEHHHAKNVAPRWEWFVKWLRSR